MIVAISLVFFFTGMYNHCFPPFAGYLLLFANVIEYLVYHLCHKFFACLQWLFSHFPMPFSLSHFQSRSLLLLLRIPIYALSLFPSHTISGSFSNTASFIVSACCTALQDSYPLLFLCVLLLKCCRYFSFLTNIFNLNIPLPTLIL